MRLLEENMNHKLNVSHSIENDALVIVLAGSATVTTAPTLQFKLSRIVDEEETKTIILDAEKLEYISSAGLRTILKVAKDVSENNRTLCICSLTSSVQRIFETSGFDKILSIYSDKQTALSASSKSKTPLTSAKPAML